jgi:hypothetical protein
MKKIFIISFILMFFLGGCLGKKEPVSGGDSSPAPAAKEPGKSLLNWIKTESGAVCAIKTESGEVTVYSQGEKIRMEGLGFDPGNPGAMSIMINDGQYFYAWSNGVGTKLNLAEAQEISRKPGMDAEVASGWDWQGMVGAWEEEQAEYDCREESFDSELFVPVGEVEFVDLGEQLREAMEIEQVYGEMFDGQDVVPNKTIPSAPN